MVNGFSGLSFQLFNSNLLTGNSLRQTQTLLQPFPDIFFAYFNQAGNLFDFFTHKFNPSLRLFQLINSFCQNLIMYFFRLSTMQLMPDFYSSPACRSTALLCTHRSCLSVLHKRMVSQSKF